MSKVVEAKTLRERVERLEFESRAVPQEDCPVRHYFAPGLFAREMTIRAGVYVVGAVHKTDNLAVLSKGRLLLATEEGPAEIAAPCTVAVKAGSKNAVTALEDSVWTNFLHNPTNETSIDRLVEMFTESKASDLIGGATNKQLAANRAAELEG